MSKIGPRNPILVRLLIIIGSCLVAVAIITFSLITVFQDNGLNYDIGKRDFSKQYHDFILTSYQSYVNFTKTNNIPIDLKQESFNSRYYLVSYQEYDKCSEAKPKEFIGVNVSDSINIQFKVFNKCGWCKSHIYIYLIEIPKIEDIDIPINYEYIFKKENLNCGDI